MNKKLKFLANGAFDVADGGATINGKKWLMLRGIEAAIGRRFDEVSLRAWSEEKCQYLKPKKLRCGFIKSRTASRQVQRVRVYNEADLKNIASAIKDAECTANDADWRSADDIAAELPDASRSHLYVWAKKPCLALGRPIRTRVMRRRVSQGCREVLCFWLPDVRLALRNDSNVPTGWVSGREASKRYQLSEDQLRAPNKMT